MNPSSDTSTNHPQLQAKLPPASFFRLMAAIVYDGILLFSALFLSSIPLIAMFEKLTGETLNQHPGYYLYVFWLYLMAFLYFGWFWTRSGQTPGMKAWYLRILPNEKTSLGWATALKRYLVALVSWSAAGLGFLWVVISKNRMTWHDTVSGTRLVVDKPSKN